MATDLRRVEEGRGLENVAGSAAADSEATLIDYVEQMAAAIKTRGMKARPIANFFSMASIEFLRNLARTCERVGVYALNFVDAAGSMGPAACRYVVAEVKKAAPGLTLGMHTHNDLGLATANALAGVEAGASQVDVTINGAGAQSGQCHHGRGGRRHGIPLRHHNRNRLEQIDRPVETFRGIVQVADTQGQTAGWGLRFHRRQRYPQFSLASRSVAIRADQTRISRQPETQPSRPEVRDQHTPDAASGDWLDVPEERLPRLWERFERTGAKRRALTEEEIRACVNAAQG